MQIVLSSVTNSETTLSGHAASAVAGQNGSSGHAHRAEGVFLCAAGDVADGGDVVGLMLQGWAEQVRERGGDGKGVRRGRPSRAAEVRARVIGGRCRGHLDDNVLCEVDVILWMVHHARGG